MHPICIGLIGDYRPTVRAHGAIPKALALADRAIATEWLPTETVKSRDLSSFAGLWCVPGSPYNDMEGALNAIRTARQNGIPFLGTCGGFQHALIEFARNELQIQGADHLESNPEAKNAIVAPLACSLVGAKGTIQTIPGTLAASLCGEDAEAEYHCNYGLNPQFASAFEGSEIVLSGVDSEGAWRIVELPSHPFFMAALFQPELAALEGRLHPIVKGFALAVRRQGSRLA